MRTPSTSEHDSAHAFDARSLVAELSKRLAPKSLKRKALVKPNIAYLRWRFLSNRERTFKAWLHRPLHSDARTFAEEIKKRGISLGPSSKYLTPDGQHALLQASALVLGLSREEDVVTRIQAGTSSERKDYCIHLVPYNQPHAPDSCLLRIGLDRKLLEIVSAYLGMWPRLNTIGAWLNYPTKDALKESQLWHRDPEDIQTIKVFIYLTDVADSDGPFCYIPSTQPFGAKAAIVPTHRDPHRITDKEMRTVIPESCWETCTGPANTMILADTVGYHRGGKTIRDNRILLTFTYTSATPIMKRNLAVTGEPTWLAHPMQHFALALSASSLADWYSNSGHHPPTLQK